MLARSHGSPNIRASLSPSPAKFNTSSATTQGNLLFKAPAMAQEHLALTLVKVRKKEHSTIEDDDGPGAGSASKGRGLTPLQRRRGTSGGSTLGSSGAYRLANRMANLSNIDGTRNPLSPEQSVLAPRPYPLHRRGWLTPAAPWMQASSWQ